jgi:hypothetical protein
VSDFAAFCQALPGDKRPPECEAADPPTTIDKPEQIVGKLNSTFQSALLGSTVVSNPVIETFTQTQIGEDNCLGCHNSIQYQPSNPNIPALKASMLNVSHIILEAYVATAPKPQ